MVKRVRYLHSCGIAHGDIKAVSPLALARDSIVAFSRSQPNIIISDSTPPLVMLADFGITRVMTFSVKMSSKEQGTTSFMAPELLLPSKFGRREGVSSKEADVYALGMAVYQVLTGKRPFFTWRIAEVVHAVISGGRPPKPENAEEIGMTDIVWDLLTECWREDRTTRPTAVEVLRNCEITGGGKAIDSALEATIVAAPWSPYVVPGQEEIFGAGETNPVRGDNTADLPTKGYPRIRNRDIGLQRVRRGLCIT